MRYVNADKKPCSLYVGKIAKRDAESIGSKVDHIVSRQITGSDPEPNVSEWVNKLPEKLHRKLVKAGLAAPRTPHEPELQPEPQLAPTLKQWTDDYIKNYPGTDATTDLLKTTARSLCKKLGPSRRIDDINAGDAEVYRKWLQTKGNERKKYQTGLAGNTVRGRIGHCKQFFKAAIKHEWIDRNPFADEASAVSGNAERLFLVPAAWVESCIKKAPCEDWRIIFAFARYAGMRSHETRIQRWDDIDLPNNRMLVRSNKNPPIRSCPIFPELRQHLLWAKEMAPSGAEYVQIRYSHDANILTTLEKIVTAAGLVPWPKLMQNLRATRETELLADYPAKDVCSWLGNSPDVANKHYAMTMQASFDRAVIDGAKIVGVTDWVTSKVPIKVPRTVQDNLPLSQDTKKADCENPVNNWVYLAKSLADLPLSCPTRTAPTAENTGCTQQGSKSTHQSTQQPAALFADCMRQHLTDHQLQELMRHLGVTARS